MGLENIRKSFRYLLVKTGFVVWRQAWWFVLAAAALAFAFQRYSALVFIIVFAFAVSIIARISSFLARLGSKEPHDVTVQFHFAKWGLLLISFAFLFSAIAIFSGVSLLYLVGGLLVSIIISDGLLGALCVGDIKVEKEMPEHIFADEPFRVKLRIRNNKRLLPCFGLRILDSTECETMRISHESVVLFIPPGAEVTVDYEMNIPERGLHRVDPVGITSSFPLGILEKVAEVRGRSELLVLPKLGTLLRRGQFQRMSMEQNIARQYLPQPRQLEFFGLREYREGDNPRHIHWRTSARKQQLYVKEFDRRQGKNILILLDTYIPEGYDTLPGDRRENLETAISFAATLARDFLKEGCFYAFAASQEQVCSIPFDVGPGHFFHVLETLAKIKPNQSSTLIELVEGRDISQFGGALIVAVSLGAVPGRFVHEFMSPQTFLVDVDSPEFAYEFDRK